MDATTSPASHRLRRCPNREVETFSHGYRVSRAPLLIHCFFQQRQPSYESSRAGGVKAKLALPVPREEAKTNKNMPVVKIDGRRLRFCQDRLRRHPRYTNHLAHHVPFSFAVLASLAQAIEAPKPRTLPFALRRWGPRRPETWPCPAVAVH